MKVTGIIAEYNPFHNGHLYQLKEARKKTQADYVIVIMSGSFVQRGQPAILDKYTRTRLALNAGADLVLELPTLFATSSADYFAESAVSILDGLGLVTDLSFGAENDDLRLLGEVANLNASEPKLFREKLDENLRSGMNFPKARGQALSDYLREDSYLPEERIAAITEAAMQPNNILAISYLTALYKLGSTIRPVPIVRLGDGYNEETLSESYSSATAIRRLYQTSTSDFPDAIKKKLRKNLPEEVFLQLQSHAADKALLSMKDFDAMLFYSLRNASLADLSNIADGSADLARRTRNLLPTYRSCDSFAEELKSKQITRAHIDRYLLHCMLGVTEQLRSDAVTEGFAPYARILGCRKDASPLLSAMHEHTTIPILTNLAKDTDGLSDVADALFAVDLRATDLYRYVLSARRGKEYPGEFSRPLLMV